MPKISRTIAIDTECTGVDAWHGAKPFFVSMYDGTGEPVFCHWRVDPNTREPLVVREDIQYIQSRIDHADTIIMQNGKFDIRMLTQVGVQWRTEHWDKHQDTLIAGHLLASSAPHDLTTMAMLYLRTNIQPLEDNLKQAVRDSRKVIQRLYPRWRTAREGLQEMPSASGSAYAFDYFFPRTLCEHEDYPTTHNWYTALEQYALADPVITYKLWEWQWGEIKRRQLEKIYHESMKLPRIVSRMEATGVTINGDRHQALIQEYREECTRLESICMNLSNGVLETMPKSGCSNGLKKTLFEVLQLPVVGRTPKTGEPSTNKGAIEAWLATLPENTKQYRFVKNLSGFRSRSRAIGDMEGYQRAWLPIEEKDGWWVLHPSLNQTGTVTLRFSSNDPNEQNISKKEGFNLRYLFGPAPGREWWSFDYSNLELRIPAYEAEETEMVHLFEHPEEPPFYGSYHMLIFETLHPEKFAKHGMASKKVFASTWYQWTKNGNFAIQYGAVESSGTADRAYHVQGAQRRIRQRFNKITQLSNRMISFAERHGYVETIPDRTVDPLRGYPLQCQRTERGKILATVPLSYHVQGTAMWVTRKAMTLVQNYFDTLEVDALLVMQVHDELVIDLPKSQNSEHNLPIVKHVKKLMCSVGDDIGVPLEVGVERHEDNWSTGTTIKVQL